MQTLFEQVTTKIIAAIEDGVGTYRMPWHTTDAGSRPSNAITGRAYRGCNTLILWAEAQRCVYSSSTWATYRQWSDHGAQVRKGERSTIVLFWKPIGFPSAEPREDDEGPQQRGTFARAFRVFNADQVDGYQPKVIAPLDDGLRISAAEEFFNRLPAGVWFGSDRAFFDPQADLISMPSFEHFRKPEGFYSVLAHEEIHWTGAKSRLDRNLSGRFGTESYAAEELVAELGAAFLTAHLGLSCEPREDHAPYIKSWLSLLRNDPKAIVTAASKAQAAADYLIDLANPAASDAAVPSSDAQASRQPEREAA